jgi:Flp pilus assembly protein TadD
VEEAQVKGMKLLKSKDKKEAEAQFAQGVALLKDEEMNKAVEAFKAALKLEPEFPEAFYNLAVLGALLDNQNFAVDAVSRGLKIAPEDAGLLRLKKSIHNLFMSA